MSNGCLEDVALKLAAKIEEAEGVQGEMRDGEAGVRAYWFTLYAECLQAVKGENRESGPKTV